MIDSFGAFDFATDPRVGDAAYTCHPWDGYGSRWRCTLLYCSVCWFPCSRSSRIGTASCGRVNECRGRAARYGKYWAQKRQLRTYFCLEGDYKVMDDDDDGDDGDDDAKDHRDNDDIDLMTAGFLDKKRDKY